MAQYVKDKMKLMPACAVALLCLWAAPASPAATGSWFTGPSKDESTNQTAAYYMQDISELLQVNAKARTSSYQNYKYWDVRVDEQALRGYLKAHDMEVPSQQWFEDLLRLVVASGMNPVHARW